MCSGEIRKEDCSQVKAKGLVLLEICLCEFFIAVFLSCQIFSNSNSFWTSIHPEYQSEHNVCEWLQFCCDQYKLDAKCTSLSHFNINGLQLCNMTQEQFVDAADLCGEYLYFILQNSRTHG